MGRRRTSDAVAGAGPCMACLLTRNAARPAGIAERRDVEANKGTSGLSIPPGPAGPIQHIEADIKKINVTALTD